MYTFGNTDLEYIKVKKPILKMFLDQIVTDLFYVNYKTKFDVSYVLLTLAGRIPLKF